jgi:hypothetical protein
MIHKFIHCTYLEKRISSICNHCEEERSTAFDEGLPWDVYLHISGHRINSTSKLCLFFDRLRYYFQVVIFIRKYEFVILRYIPADPFFALLILLFGQKICTVHHTIEKKEILNKFRLSLKSISKFAVELIFGSLSRTFSRCLIVKTNEIGIYQGRHSIGKSNFIIYPNAGGKNHTIEDRRSVSPTLLFIGSNLTQPWQGLDIILNFLNDLHLEYRFHVIGEASLELEDMMRENPQVTYHGVLNEKQIIQVSSFCDIGLSVFGLHRKNMREACPLKVRQYLNLGLPVYLPHKDVFPETFKFVHYQKENISEMIEYCLKSKMWSKQEVIIKSKKYIGRKQIMERTIKQLRRNFVFDVSDNLI